MRGLSRRKVIRSLAALGAAGSVDWRLSTVVALILLMQVACGLRAHAESISFVRGTDRIDVTVGGRPYTTYYFSKDIAKPYLMPIRSAAGTVVTRNFPDGNGASSGDPRDPAFEPHQRPLYFGHGNINGLDFWQEEVFLKYYNDHGKQRFGRMVMREVEEVRPGPDSGLIRARFDLLDSSGAPIAAEVQSFTFRGDKETRTIDCDITLLASYGPVTLGDTKEGTFALRLTGELSGAKVKMISSTGAEGEPRIWGKPADWVDYSSTVAGEPLGVAIFDNPSNFRHPTTWHARAYGLFSVNPFGWRAFRNDPNADGSWTIPEGKSLRLRYRVLIHHGLPASFNVAAAYARYLSKEP